MSTLVLCLKVAKSFLETSALNTSTSWLIQVVRKQTAGSHVALCRNISASIQVTDLVKVSKDVASLVVCTRKIFLVGGAGFLSVMS